MEGANKVLLAVFFLSCILPSNVIEAQCLDPFIELDTGCYYFSNERNEMTASWSESSELCQLALHENVTKGNADLFIVHTEDEVEAIDAYLNQNGAPDSMNWYIGASDFPIEGSWTWLEGQSVPPRSPIWHCGAPERNFLKNCLNLVVTIESDTKRLRYDDRECNIESYFICEYSEE